MYIHTHTRTCTRIPACTHTHMHIQTQRRYRQRYRHSYRCRYQYIHPYIHPSIHPSIRPCMHACVRGMYIHTCIHTYIRRNIQHTPRSYSKLFRPRFSVFPGPQSSDFALEKATVNSFHHPSRTHSNTLRWDSYRTLTQRPRSLQARNHTHATGPQAPKLNLNLFTANIPKPFHSL